MKRPKPAIKPSEGPVNHNVVIATSIPMLDPVGVHEDDEMLYQSGWAIGDNVEDHATYAKANGTLRLRVSQDEEMEHRVKWEMTIHAGETQVGYSTITLRPGDMNGSTTKRLVEEALEAGEAEFKKWSDALAEARSILQT